MSLEYRRYRGLGALWSWYSIGATLLNLLWWGVYYWVGGYSAPASLGLTAYETVRVLYVLLLLLRLAVARIATGVRGVSNPRGMWVSVK